MLSSFADTTITALPDIEPITSDEEKKIRRSKKKQVVRSTNPFLDNDAVVNPFMSYEPLHKVQRKKKVIEESRESSTLTLFDENNPFRSKSKSPCGINQSKCVRSRPLPPQRVSSLIKADNRSGKDLDLGENNAENVQVEKNVNLQIYEGQL